MRRAAPGLVVLAALLAGCSQAAALAPVGGGPLAEVRFAAIDVLLERDVEFIAAPVCRSTATDLVCHGTTAAGEPIEVVSPGQSGDTMIITVAAREVYSGSVTDVLDGAARPK